MITKEDILKLRKIKNLNRTFGPLKVANYSVTFESFLPEQEHLDKSRVAMFIRNEDDEDIDSTDYNLIRIFEINYNFNYQFYNTIENIIPILNFLERYSKLRLLI